MYIISYKCFFFSELEFYGGNEQLPIYENIPTSRKRLYSATDIAKILLNPKLPGSKQICTTVPVSIERNVSFIVDTTKLEDTADILSDDMGAWKHNGVDTGYFNVSMNSNGISVEKIEEPTSDQTYTVKRVYRVHGTNRSLKKLTAYILGKSFVFSVARV